MNSSIPNDQTTHFGYQQVPTHEKKHRVAGVFDSVVNRYDVMNDVMSFGIHRIWKRLMMEMCGVRAGQAVLDLACGTGDLTARLCAMVGADGHVIAADINNAMLQRGRARLIDKGFVGNVTFVRADAEALPFPENSFNCVTMAFGLRNVTDKQSALESIYRVIKPGGRVLILEFSTPTIPVLQPVYDAYSFKLLPFMGKLITDDAESYRYLAESIRQHPDQKTLQGMTEQAGFEHCDYLNLSAGVVALHRGYKI